MPSPPGRSPSLPASGRAADPRPLCRTAVAGPSLGDCLRSACPHPFTSDLSVAGCLRCASASGLQRRCSGFCFSFALANLVLPAARDVPR